MVDFKLFSNTMIFFNTFQVLFVKCFSRVTWKFRRNLSNFADKKTIRVALVSAHPLDENHER